MATFRGAGTAKAIYHSKAKTLSSWGRPGVGDACRVEVRVLEQAEVEPWYIVRLTAETQRTQRSERE